MLRHRWWHDWWAKLSWSVAIQTLIFAFMWFLVRDTHPGDFGPLTVCGFVLLGVGVSAAGARVLGIAKWTGSELLQLTLVYRYGWAGVLASLGAAVANPKGAGEKRRVTGLLFGVLTLSAANAVAYSTMRLLF